MQVDSHINDRFAVGGRGQNESDSLVFVDTSFGLARQVAFSLGAMEWLMSVYLTMTAAPKGPPCVKGGFVEVQIRNAKRLFI